MPALLLLCALFASEESAVLDVIQRLFDAMAAHDAAALQSVLLPEGRVVSVRADGVLRGSSHPEWAARIAASKDSLRETIRDPKVLIQGRIASVWAPYDFYRDGQRSHGGIDSFSLVKTADGWRIATLVYTVETR
ncbi:MAG: nuclear transport factor 2 family protein [Bryobacteraceae bacterium]